ncbi:MAG: hypothetical protein HYV63_17455 [Candidatus Schekmanbacteria bacterium]|nr:hypothetical protein [Candidatus Schekmanbacteria bacterium]
MLPAKVGVTGTGAPRLCAFSVAEGGARAGVGVAAGVAAGGTVTAMSPTTTCRASATTLQDAECRER